MVIQRFQTLLYSMILTVSSIGVVSADWPMYRADANRSGVTRESVKFPLVEHWRYESGQRPEPAWPDPGKERHRLDFDNAPQLVVAENTVFFGSSADDTLRALNVQTAALRWTFTTGGPLRFAPAISKGRVYLASDDGFLYCLDATNGKLIWKFHAAHKHDQILGNGRLISRWPLRSGVLVVDDVAYVTAGMWPSEGVMIYAIDARSGDIIWCNDNSDSKYLAQPHAKAFSLTGVSPQGYLLATDKSLLVPTGRGVPAAFDRQTGELSYFKPSDSKTHGESWAMIAGNRLFNGGLIYEVATGAQVECPSTKVPIWAKRDFEFGTRQHVLGYRGSRILADGKRIFGRRTGYCLALAGDVLLEGNDGKLSAFDAKSKKQEALLWEAALLGQVRSLAVSSGAIFAATDQGTVHGFSDADAISKAESIGIPARIVVKEQKATRSLQNADAEQDKLTQTVFTLAKQSKLSKGYAVVIGAPQVAHAIALRNHMHVLCLVSDDKEIAPLRERLVQAGIYGTKIVVQSLQGLRDKVYPAYFANLVVVGADTRNVNAEQLWRVLRPCGGLIVIDEAARKPTKTLFESVEDPPVQQGETEGVVWMTRGKLPGAFDWDSETTSDQRVKWPLELAWFGGPGPARMQDRHRAWIAPPVVANGRYFVPGEHHVIAVDAYNGTELWSHQFAKPIVAKDVKPIRLVGLAADDQHTYFSIGDEWIKLDAQTGEVVGSVKELPEGLEQWGRLAKRYEPYATRLRTHALTGEQVPRIYYRAYGCNQVLVADGVDFFRSGTLGLYDLEDDSGLRNFGGVRPGCWRSHNAAFGVFLSSEGSSGCVCTYNFQTSLMLAPARKQRHEDWAVYHDVPAAGLVRHVSINLGAPGDRRDKMGRLWLGYPRHPEAIALQLPVTTEVGPAEGAGPYHFDSDRRPINETSRPWIYASGYRGMRQLKISLDQQQPIVALQQKSAPQIDGRLAVGEWPEKPQASLQPVHNRQNRGAPNRQLIKAKDWESRLRFIYSAEHLFVAFRQANRVDRRGKPYQWRAKTKGSNVPVWIDDSYELFVTDTTHQIVLHFGVSASGATYDAQLKNPADRETAAWNGKWQSATIADDKGFVVEMAIPWSTIEDAGLSKKALLINAQSNWSGWNAPIRYLGSGGRRACENFSPLGLNEAPASPERRFRVRLHFAEPDKRQATARQFDVTLQGEKVLSDFDIRQEAGGADTAIVKEFINVAASKDLTIELSPSNAATGGEVESILSGIEIEEMGGTEATP